MQLALPELAEYVPGAQLVHVSKDACAVRGWTLPASQTVQTVPPAAGAKVPVAQAKHALFDP